MNRARWQLVASALPLLLWLVSLADALHFHADARDYVAQSGCLDADRDLRHAVFLLTATAFGTILAALQASIWLRQHRAMWSLGTGHADRRRLRSRVPTMRRDRAHRALRLGLRRRTALVRRRRPVCGDAARLRNRPRARLAAPPLVDERPWPCAAYKMSQRVDQEHSKALDRLRLHISKA